MPYKVKFVDFPASYKEIKPEIDKAIQKVLNKGDFILRDEVEKFEKALAKYTGTKYAVGTNSGTDALFLSLKALGIGKGDEVITTGYTFWATVEAIINCGATPVLVDINKYDLLIDPEDIKKKITANTKAIIPVHIGGDVCKMKTIKAIAKEWDLYIIEDSAQALGASKLVGDVACFSFYPAKVLGCYGDGGAIVTNKKKLADRIRLLRNHGGKPHPQFVGYNSRLDNLQAAILNVRLKTLPRLIKRRQEIAKIYDKGLCDIVGIELPTSFTYQEYNFELLTWGREKLYEYLKEAGIETIKGDYTFPMEAPMIVKKANKTILRLPIWPTLKDYQIKYVIKTIENFYAI